MQLGDRLDESKKENEKSGMTWRNVGNIVEKVQEGMCFIRGGVGNDEFSFSHSFFLSFFNINLLATL